MLTGVWVSNSEMTLFGNLKWMNESWVKTRGVWSKTGPAQCGFWVMWPKKQDQRDEPSEIPDRVAILGYLRGPGGLISPLGVVAREKAGPWDEEGKEQLAIRTI